MLVYLYNLLVKFSIELLSVYRHCSDMRVSKDIVDLYVTYKESSCIFNPPRF
jgi:hypothetical protein